MAVKRGNNFVCRPTKTNTVLVIVAAQHHFYFRQKSLIDYDRKKMSVWGQWRLQILPNNQEEASHQPISPSWACYTISFIFLINFLALKVCGGGGGGLKGVSSTLHLQWRVMNCLNSNVNLNCPCWNNNEFENEHKIKAALLRFFPPVLSHIILSNVNLTC